MNCDRDDVQARLDEDDPPADELHEQVPKTPALGATLTRSPR